jgi:hypothetical protein
MNHSQPENPQQNPQPALCLSETTASGTILYMFGEQSQTTNPPPEPGLLERLNAARKLHGLPPLPPMPRPRPPQREGPDARS